MPAVIRTATVADLDALLALYAQLNSLNESTAREEAERGLRASIEHPDVRLFVAEDGGTVIGTATAVVAPGLTHNGRAWMQVENVVVDASIRGTGVGRALMDACVDFARERGCYKIQLQSGNQRTDSHRFYERFGFQPSTVGFRLYLD